MLRSNAKYGLATLCVGGGMGTGRSLSNIFNYVYDNNLIFYSLPVLFSMRYKENIMYNEMFKSFQSKQKKRYSYMKFNHLFY